MSGGSPLGRQRGVAAITAMLIVALATALAVELMWKLNLDLRRTEAMLTRDQAAEYALGAESWVIDILQQDLGSSSTGTDHLQEAWAVDIPPLPVEGGAVDGQVVDLQGRFNLNKLIDGSGRRNQIAYEQFQRLLELLELDPGLADAVVDWIDPDDMPSLSGAEDDRYTARQPPYRTANFWFTTPSELMSIEGFDQETYARLAPHVSALPPLADGALIVNVNTATEEVLRSLDPGLSTADVQRWLDERPFDDRTPFEGDVDPTILPGLGVSTHYFGLTVMVSIGSARLSMYSLLNRTDQGVVPLLRSYDVN